MNEKQRSIAITINIVIYSAPKIVDFRKCIFISVLKSAASTKECN
jgi:hypothetical protein